MKDTIVASTDGTAGPYIVVSTGLSEALCHHIIAQKHSCSGPREAAFLGSKATDCVLETPERPKEIEPAIDAWFSEQKILATKTKSGDENDPSSIYWEFTSPE